MPLSFNANWLAAFSQSRVKPILRVEIQLSSTAIYVFVSGDDTLFGYPNMVVRVKPASQTLDVFERKVTVGQWEVDFADAGEFIRNLVAGSIFFKGKRAGLRLGEAALVESDFVDLANNLAIEDIYPQKGGYILETFDAFTWAVQDQIDGYREPGHPLRIMRNLLQPILPAGVVNFASLNELPLTNTSHHVVTRFPYNWSAWIDFLALDVGIDFEDKTLMPVREMVDALAFLAYGSMYPELDGTFTFRAFSYSAAAVRHIEQHEISDFHQPTTFENIVNQVEINGRRHDGKDITYVRGHDQAAIDAFAWPVGGTPGKRYSKSFKSEWLNNFVQLTDNFNSTDTTLTIRYPEYHGFCGTMEIDGAGDRILDAYDILDNVAVSQQAGHQLNGTTRVGLFVITDNNGNGERVLATAGVLGPNLLGGVPTPLTAPNVARAFRQRCQYTVTRGYHSTPVIDWDAIRAAGGTVYVYDLTIAQHILDQIIPRTSYGVPIVQFRLNVRHLDLRLGEVFSFDHSECQVPGHQRADNTIRWEVMQIEPDPISSSPGIRVTAAYLNRDTISPGTVTDEWDIPPVVASESTPEFYYDASGAIYTNATGMGYTGPG